MSIFSFMNNLIISSSINTNIIITTTTIDPGATTTSTTTTTTLPEQTTTTTTTTVAPITFTRYNISDGCNNFEGSGFGFPNCPGIGCNTSDPLGSDINFSNIGGQWYFSVNPIISNPQGSTTFQWWARSYANGNCNSQSIAFIITDGLCWSNTSTSTIRFYRCDPTYYKIWCRVTNNGITADSNPYFLDYWTTP